MNNLLALGQYLEGNGRILILTTRKLFILTFSVHGQESLMCLPIITSVKNNISEIPLISAFMLGIRSTKE